jgi:hypothetical protein
VRKAGAQWCEPSLPSWTLAVSNKDSHAATEWPGPILDSLESCRLGFRSSPAAVTWGESAACQHGEGDTQAMARRSKSCLEAPELAVQRAMRKKVQADPRGVWREYGGPLVPSLGAPQAPVSAQREHISKANLAILTTAGWYGTRPWLALIRRLPSLYPHAAP